MKYSLRFNDNTWILPHQNSGIKLQSFVCIEMILHSKHRLIFSSLWNWHHLHNSGGKWLCFCTKPGTWAAHRIEAIVRRAAILLPADTYTTVRVSEWRVGDKERRGGKEFVISGRFSFSENVIYTTRVCNIAPALRESWSQEYSPNNHKLDTRPFYFILHVFCLQYVSYMTTCTKRKFLFISRPLLSAPSIHSSFIDVILSWRHISSIT
jgi:hypothetical protein